MTNNRIWVPTLGTHCGISEYTQYLNVSLKATLLKELPLNPFTDGTLHIQHEYGYFDASGRLAAYLYKHCQSIPYFITEHSVRREDRAEPFELYPTGIVVHTQKQKEIVQGRTNVPVTLIPHGIFYRNVKPKIRRKTKVIGAFGFMTETKGFDKLTSLMAKREDYHLLLFSSDISNGTFQRKLKKKINLLSNITYISDFLPQKIVAEKLTREADVLVYWYKESSNLSASGAASIGLSTGVPILGTRTSWFDDLPVQTSYHLESGIDSLLEDDIRYYQLSQEQLEYCWQNRWEIAAQKHKELWNGG